MEALAQLNPVTKSFLAGSLSGTCSTLLFQPLDLVKTRQQVSAKSPSLSMIRTIQTIVAQDTLAGLWRGLLPSICRTVPGVGLYFSSMHWMKSQTAGRPSTLQSLLIGATARAFAASAMIPFTVLKTRFESGSFQYRGLGSALVSIVKTEGGIGLCRGLAPTLLRDAPFSALYLACYEALKANLPGQETSPISHHLLCGLGAGVLASLATHPADRVKTTMQLAGAGSPGVLATTAAIQASEGLKGFTVGVMPRLLRRTCMAALAWSVYERMLTTMALR